MSTTLAVVFLLVILSGLGGLALQQWLPRLMLERLPAETIYAQIDNVSQRLLEDATRLVEATCGVDHQARPEENQIPAFVTVERMRSVSQLRERC